MFTRDVDRGRTIAATRMETGTDTTALQFFVNNSPYIKSMDHDGDGKISRVEYEIFLLEALHKLCSDQL